MFGGFPFGGGFPGGRQNDSDEGIISIIFRSRCQYNWVLRDLVSE